MNRHLILWAICLVCTVPLSSPSFAQEMDQLTGIIANQSNIATNNGINIQNEYPMSYDSWAPANLSSAASNETRVVITGPPIEVSGAINSTGYAPEEGVPTPIGAPEALDAQNAYRAAAGMSPMVWSTTLASSAQTWAQHLADTNTFVHSCPTGNCGYGENLAAGWPSNSITDTYLVKSWGDEKQFFKCGTFPDVSTTGDWHAVGHYTQMIWPATTQCGCGEAISSADHKILVCQYQPPGNVVGQYICPKPPVSGWTSLGGNCISWPAPPIKDNQGRNHVFVIGSDTRLYDNRDGTWLQCGGSLKTAPFAVKDSSGRIHVFAAGSDDALWDKIVDTSTNTIGPWKYLGGKITAMPTAVRVGNAIKIATRGSDNSLWICNLDTTTLTPSWHGYGGSFGTIPYIIYDATSSPQWHVYVGNGALWACDGPSGTWHNLGGSIKSSPQATVDPGWAGQYHAIMARGDDGALWMCSHTAGSTDHNWWKLGGIVSAYPAFVSSGPSNRIHTFVQGSDGALWENTFSSYPWNPSGNKWFGHGGSTAMATAALIDGSTTKAYVTGKDGALWRDTFTTTIASPVKEKADQKLPVMA